MKRRTGFTAVAALTAPAKKSRTTMFRATFRLMPFFAALLLSYSRASLLNVAVALLVLAWRNRKRVRILRAAACVAALALLCWRAFPAFVEMYWLRLSYSAEYLFTATERVLSGRVDSWRTLAGWISAHPWQTMFGIGYKTLPYSSYLGSPVVADNMYLSLLVETGVAGLAALVWLNIAILRAAGYKAACHFVGGAADWPPGNPFHLSRIAVWPDSDFSKGFSDQADRR